MVIDSSTWNWHFEGNRNVAVAQMPPLLKGTLVATGGAVEPHIS